MTFDPADYHADWPSIRQQILDQADHACEFCGAPNGETGDHDREGRWVDMETILHRYGVEGEGYHDDFPRQSRPVTVVLTIAHLCQAKRCIDPTHLLALCQRCHLSIQGRVYIDRPWVMFEHSEWFKPYVAAFYARKYLGLDLAREETEARIDELLELERAAVMGETA